MPKHCQFCNEHVIDGRVHAGPRKKSKQTPAICYECVERLFEKQTAPVQMVSLNETAEDCPVGDH